nr:hypothetical protein Iba_chr06eCG1660 [Ipomoea batatas]GMD13773.1 hypothetical protein Iba_scaffold1046918CG0010 [Ipomoea batatas]GMD24658.1 hypothetical protein Iba_chr08cCG2690 [Ipomoea batatas]GMD46802.1 hypothetical protein Iba_chr10eCG6830 [Ipomoea batatas]GMD55222.1 hypothetical protein Iba_chr11dCG5880 [Ipomoea batatas]
MVNVGVGGSGGVVVITPVADGVSLQSLLGKMATKEMKEEPEFYSTSFDRFLNCLSFLFKF